MTAPQLRPRRAKADTYPDNCISEDDTPHGYWWMTSRVPKSRLAICVGFQLADAEARRTGRTYFVASTALPSPAVYVFACDHPDARNAAITIMVEQTPPASASADPAFAAPPGIDP
jgi:hypothetical protein